MKYLNPENTVIVTDDAADLTKAACDALKIQSIPISTQIEKADGTIMGWQDNEHIDEIYRELSAPDTVKASTGHMLYEFVRTFTDVFNSGRDLIYAGIHKDISGMYEVAHVAEELVREKHPEFKDRRIIYADTRSISGGLGFYITELANWYNATDRTEEEVETKLAELAWFTNHTFTVLSYDFMLRSGRFTKLEDFTVRRLYGPLKIHPIMLAGHSGRLQSRYAQVKGDKKLISYFVDTVIDQARADKVWIAHGDTNSRAFAQEIADRLQAIADLDITFHRIGGSIACHTGPDPFAVFFLQRTPRPDFD